MYPNTQLYIQGQWQDAQSGESLAILNPATEQEIGRVAKARIADLDLALAAAEQGFAVWKNTSPAERAKVMKKAANLLRDRVDQIAEIMTLEQGKPINQAKIETLGAADVIDWFAGEAVRS